MKYLIILASLIFFTKVKAQSFVGSIAYGKSNISYQIKLIKEDNEINAFFSSIDLNAYEIPCQKTTLKNDSLHFYVFSDYYTYEYRYNIENEVLKGNLKIFSSETEQLLNTFETTLNPINSSEIDAIEKKDFSFKSNELQLYGTLWKPNKSNQKGLFFVTSSQGNDRSGSNAEAYYFANLGFTIFNYDKRGTGKSEGNWQTATIEELCSDDINAIRFFSTISTLSLSNIGIKGSSQGGIKIPYILSKMPDLGFGISISCPDGTLLESDLNRWKNLNISQIGKSNINKALIVQKAGYDYVAGNLSYDEMIKLKMKYNNEDWLKYVWFPEQDIQKDEKLNFTGLSYFKKITQPILVIQGLSDEVIPIKSYKTIEKAIKKSKVTDYKIITLDNTTHSLTYLNHEFPYFQTLNPKYLPEIHDWLQKVK